VTLDIPAGIAGQIAGRVNDLLSRIDTIMLGEADIAPLGATKPEALIARGVKRVALKRGASGSALFQADSEAHAKGLDVSVVDTTGAGDAFAAGQIVGRLADLPGETCCLLANALGAAAVRRSGAGLAMPGSEEVRYLLGIDREAPAAAELSLIASVLRD
jgi:ribokinase